MQLPQNYNMLNSRERREVRLHYIEVQNNECWYCKSNINEEPPQEILDKRIELRNFPKGFLQNPIHLHHDHNTDMTIGAVHAYCNAVLWEWHGE